MSFQKPHDRTYSHYFTSRRRDDNAPSPMPHIRDHSPSPIPLDFSALLAAAANKKSKVAPLYEKKGKRCMIRLRALQHMIVCNLRRHLAVEVKTICDTNSASPVQMERIRKLMTDYVSALRDLRYMLEAPSQNDAVSKFLIDQLYISSYNDPAIMIDAGFISSNKYSPELRVPDYTGYGGYSFRQESGMQQTAGFLSRLRMALFGGCSLIAPMLIMRLHPTRVTELVTTSVFILAVSIILAWYMRDAQKRDILAATATYAAVLVVFVGSTN